MKHLFTFALICLLATASSAQISFERIYDYGIGTSICPLPNGEYVAGVSYPLYGIARLDAQGNLINFQSITNSTVNNIRQSNDGGFVYTGMDRNNSYATVSKIDANGESIWTRNFEPNGFSAVAAGIIPLADNTYIFNMSSNGPAATVPYEIFKLDDAGNEIWRNFPGDGQAKTHSLMNASNSVIDAYTTHVGDEFGVITLASIDKTNGHTQWTRTFYDPALMIENTYPGYSLEANGSCLSSNNEIYIAGSKSLMSEPRNGVAYQFIMKTDVSGTPIWTKSYGKGKFDQINQTSDGGLALIGKDDNVNGLFLKKIDIDGNQLWQASFNALSTSSALDFHETSDHGFIISGYAYHDQNNTYYTYIIKTDSLGRVGNVTTVNSSSESVFHNARFSPTIIEDKATLELPNQALDFRNHAVIIDMNGKIIRDFMLHDSKTEISKGNLSAGTYTMVVDNNVSSTRFKFVIQ